MARDRRMAEEFLSVLEAAQHADSAATAGSSAILKEGLDSIRAMIGREDEGWDLWIGGRGQEDGGFNLSDLSAWSDRLTPASNASSWIGRGFRLRAQSYWQGDIQYEGIPSESRGRGVNVQEKIDHPENQRAFFAKAARTRRERRLYCEGFALWVGNDTTKLIEAVPLKQIVGTFTDPDNEGIIWAYKREWQRRQADGRPKTMVRWYFTDTYKDKQVGYITVDGKREKVETGWSAFDMHVNTVEGWKFGMPDALSAWVWSEYAKDLYSDGMDVSEAMASIIFSASTASGKGAQNAANQFASPMGPGSTAVAGAGGALAALSTAGKGYDFSSIREVVATIATSLDVSSIALTSNPGDAGSSYGSAQVLDLPGKLSALARRDEHVELDLRVLRWMAGKGEASKSIKVYFHTLDDGAEIYRKVQAVVLKWQQGLMKPEDAAEQIDDIFGIPGGYAIPKGILIPNNRGSLPRKDIDADGSTSSGAQAAAPGQGRGGAQAGGSGDRATDTRSDIQSN